MTPDSESRALDGLRVVSLSATVATGYCGRLLAAHGARVVELEPLAGAATRRLPPFKDGVPDPEASLLHAWLAAGKHSVAVDLSKATGQVVAVRLIADADVVLDGAEPGCEPVTPEEIRRCAPAAVHVRLTWYGLDGPCAGLPASDGAILARIGNVLPVGPVDGPPLVPAGHHAQMIGAVTAYNATLGQVIGRELGNVRGTTTVDVSVLEAAMCLTDVSGVSGFDVVPARPRLGINRYAPTYPLGVYPCRDGWLGVTALTPDQWHAFCALLGLDELAHVPEYQTAMGRLTDAPALEVVIADALASRSAEELFHEGQRLRIPLAPVPTMAELLATEQYRAREAFVPVQHSQYAPFAAPMPPFRLHRTPAVASAATPRLGEHTRTELARAGYDDATIARLVAERVVSTT